MTVTRKGKGVIRRLYRRSMKQCCTVIEEIPKGKGGHIQVMPYDHEEMPYGHRRNTKGERGTYTGYAVRT